MSTTKKKGLGRRLSEAPSHGLPCVVYDKSCVGSKSYFKLAVEFSKKNNIESAA